MDKNDVQDVDVAEKMHVVFLHNRLKKRTEDRYLVDIACALKDSGHKVTICTTEFDPKNCFKELNPITGSINVIYSAWWVPRWFKTFKAILMALRLVFFPPKPEPKVIIIDISTIALYFISLLSQMKTIFIAHFGTLNNAELYTKFMQITPDLITAKTLRYANEIVVQSDCLANILRRSFPNIQKEIQVIHPCVDTGYWTEDIISIDRIIPDIPKPSFLFVTFGIYRTRSNFKLVLDAFEDLLRVTPNNIKNNLHLVVAGNYHEDTIEHVLHHKELVAYSKDKSYASQVTFLKQVPTVYKKTLIHEAIGILLPCKYEVYPDMTLAALSTGRPIIATNTGFAKEALRHRITGILVEADRHLFAAAMHKLLLNPAIQVFLSDMGGDMFKKKFAYPVFTRKINSIVLKQVEKNEKLLN